jgi:hypothetical protein
MGISFWQFPDIPLSILVKPGHVGSAKSQANELEEPVLWCSSLSDVDKLAQIKHQEFCSYLKFSAPVGTSACFYQ